MRVYILFLLLVSSVYGQRISSKKISRIIKKNKIYSKAQVAVAVQPIGSSKKIKGIQFSKYMTPASNTKLLTFLGAIQTFDSLPLINYSVLKKTLHISPTGYPLLFHPKYPDLELEKFLNSYEKIIYHDTNLDIPRFGNGWAWDDYPFYFSAQISTFPLFGNVAKFSKSSNNKVSVRPNIFKITIDSLLNNKIIRNEINNTFIYNPIKFDINDTLYIPFKTSKKLTVELLSQALNSEVTYENKNFKFKNVLYSKKIDKTYNAILKSSDNLVAESMLLMIGKKLNNNFSTPRAIYTLKNKWNSWVPDPVIWNDGSGVSRYNMITPRTLVAVLQKIYNKIGLVGIQKYFAAGGESGTIKNFYKKQGSPYVYAKTGTLKHNHNLSGYLISKKGNWYVFSIMVNHFESPTNQIRLAIEDILEYIYDKG